MQLTNISLNISTKIDASLAALRRGSMVMIRDRNQRAGFIKAAEFADFELPKFPYLDQITPTLCLTKNHVEYFHFIILNSFTLESLFYNLI